MHFSFIAVLGLALAGSPSFAADPTPGPEDGLPDSSCRSKVPLTFVGAERDALEQKFIRQRMIPKNKYLKTVPSPGEITELLATLDVERGLLNHVGDGVLAFYEYLLSDGIPYPQLTSGRVCAVHRVLELLTTEADLPAFLRTALLETVLREANDVQLRIGAGTWDHFESSLTVFLGEPTPRGSVETSASRRLLLAATRTLSLIPRAETNDDVRQLTHAFASANRTEQTFLFRNILLATMVIAHSNVGSMPIFFSRFRSASLDHLDGHIGAEEWESHMRDLFLRINRGRARGIP